jgi:hypothetical protein
MFPISTPNFLPTFPIVLNRGSYNLRLNISFPTGQIIRQNLAIDLIGNNIVSYARGGNWRSMGTLTSIPFPNATVVNSNLLGGSPIFNGIDSFYTGTIFEPINYTICVWFKATGPPSNNDAGGGCLVVANSQIGLSGYLLNYVWLNSSINFGQNASTQFIASANNTAPRNTVLFVCARYNGATREIYINGELSISGSYTVNPPYPITGDRLYKVGIGNFTGFTRAFNGEIYRLSMYDRALSASEILQNYTSQRTLYGV